jgi:hypothetical protein
MVDRLSNGVFISEILADNAGSKAIDTDNDGNTTKADEFIELQNFSGATVSLSGIQIWSEKNGLLYSFGASATLGPYGTATVLGEYTGTPPPGYYSAGIPNNGNFLPDGEGQKFDTIFVLDTNTNTFITFSYGNPPRVPVQPAGFPTSATQSGTGESFDSNAPNGTAFRRDANGDFIEAPPTPGQRGPLCIAGGMRIDTAAGPVAVEDLRAGDRVLCHDGTSRALRAIGRDRLSAAVWRALPALGPVDLPAGADGRGRLSLSPNHRVLLSGASAELHLGTPEILVAAKFLGRPRLQHPGESLDYYHLLFDRHTLIRAEGVWIESLYLGDVGQGWIAAQRRAGTLSEGNPTRTDAIRHAAAVLPCARSYEAVVLAASAVAA